MKLILVSLFCLSASAQAACVNLSGKYKSEAPSSELLTVVQRECATVEFFFAPSGGKEDKQIFFLDGIMRATGTLEGITNYESSTFSYGDFILVSGENHFADNSTVQKYQRKITLVDGRVLLDEIGHFRSDVVFIP